MPWSYSARSVAFVAIGLFGCGGASFDGRVFQNGELSFRVGPVPPEWHAIEATGSLVAFRDDSAPATIAVGGRCGKDGDDVPLEALTHHLFLAFTERNIENQVKVELDGREALHTELSAKLDKLRASHGIRDEEERLCYDFWHVAPPGAAGAQRQFVAFARLRDDTPVTDQARPSRTSFLPPVKQETRLERVTREFRGLVGHVGQITDMATGTFRALFRRPFEGRAILAQLESLGVASMGIVTVTSVFIGMVMAVQFAFGLRKFGGMEYTGRVVGLSFARESLPR
jgi:hypothetical protein